MFCQPFCHSWGCQALPGISRTSSCLNPSWPTKYDKFPLLTDKFGQNRTSSLFWPTNLVKIRQVPSSDRQNWSKLDKFPLLTDKFDQNWTRSLFWPTNWLWVNIVISTTEIRQKFSTKFLTKLVDKFAVSAYLFPHAAFLHSHLLLMYINRFGLVYIYILDISILHTGGRANMGVYGEPWFDQMFA